LVLEDSLPSVIEYTTKQLQDLQVDIKFQTKVVASTQSPGGRQQLSLSSGDKLETDMYIPTFGLLPNSSYVPAEFLKSTGYVVVDEHLEVKGTKGVWAIGDVTEVENSQVMPSDRQSAYVAKSITSILSGKTAPPYKAKANGKNTVIVAAVGMANRS
jgi:NADH dehydrogenase FAD-containing subunit